MGKNSNIISINGRQYDAISGLPFSAAAHQVVAPAQKSVAPASAHQVSHSKGTVHDIIRQPAKHTKHHKPESSHTLMRHAVSKPGDSLKRRVKARGPVSAVAKQPVASIESKQLVHSVNPHRAQVAKRIPKSPAIQHFTPNASSSFTPVTPAAKPVAHPQPSAHKKDLQTHEIFEQAINFAEGHKQPAHRTKKRSTHKKKLAVSAAALSMAVIIGTLAYVNFPYIRFHMAASHAGFSATMPGAKPAGYKLSQLDAAKGAVALQYSQAGKQFSITERQSAWNSQALREMFVLGAADKYQTVDAAGRTIYLYGDGNATWVNGGVWYRVESRGALTDQQLIDLAKSL